MRVKGRTVSQIVKDISVENPETVFYIGSATGFFFIGTAETYESDIEGVSDKILKGFKAGVIKANQNIKVSLKPLSQDKNESLEKYADRLARVSKLLIDSQKIKEKLIPAIENWVPVQDRIPTGLDKKDELLDKNGVMIAVKGIESGAYWFQHEYDDAKRGGKKDGAKKDNE